MQIPETEIVVTAGGVELVRKTLRPGEYVIGREDGCDIRLEVDLISRRHAQLVVNYDHVLIEDLGSSNGTTINGRPITAATRLWPNQKIQIGAAMVELHRLKVAGDSTQSLAPQTAAVRQVLPEEFLREKKYDIGGVVAQGGMGAILNAKEATTERTVAMKVMLDGSSPEDLARFVTEARVTAQLEHPNIVPVHELSVDENDQVFYTMKFVRGITLRKVLELKGDGIEATIAKYPVCALLTVFQKVCDAVAFAHSRAVIHRDLKPENVMIGDFGEVLVMDWGLAKLLGAASVEGDRAGARARAMHTVQLTGRREATLSGSILGTPQYMAPEQARGETDTLDARADIYALGAILYHILALRSSVQGDDPWAIVEKVARGEVDALQAHSSSIPDSLVAVVRKAMAFDKAQRYASVAELQADLEAYQNGFATSAERAGAWKQFALFVRRKKAASIGAAAVLVVSTMFGTKAILEGRRAEREAAAAKTTLADLRRTAPVFYEQAKVVFSRGQFDEAMEKTGYAIQLDGAQPDYHLLRANLLQSSQQLADAAESYRRVLALRPADAAAKTNLALCEKLLQESGGQPLQRPQHLQLLAALRAQKRLLEAAPLAAVIDPDVVSARTVLLNLLHEARKQTGWNDNRVAALPDGTFKVVLSGLALIDLSVLRGQPITEVDLAFTSISDLSVLAGWPLKVLRLRATSVTDLSPVKSMPLETLDLANTPVTDLSPLRGMKLQTLNITETKVFDLEPLAGMPLTSFACGSCRQLNNLSALRGAPLKSLHLANSAVADLSPLRECKTLEVLDINMTGVGDLTPLAGLPITYLRAGGCLRLTSIAALRGMPLRILHLMKTNVTDLSPLAGNTTLEDIQLPPDASDISVLRGHPRLKLITARQGATESYLQQNAADFWAAYDAAAGK